MKIGVNTFGLKYEFEKDFDGTLQRVKEKGFTTIEICSVPDFLAEEEAKKIPAEKLEEYRNSPVAKVFLPFSKAAEFSKNGMASCTVMARTSAIFLPLYLTSSVS